jgi:spermidine synthase
MPRVSRVVALVLTVLTGFSGLVYEVAWQKYLATLLGSHSEATAAVLAIFLGGLALGYALFGRATGWLVRRSRARRTAPRLALFYGCAEAAIGIYALLFPVLFRLAQAVSYRLPFGGAAGGFAFDVLLAALLLGPPTVLMGGTIPVLTQALSRNLADATRLHALVYAFNTAGAFAGALAGGLILIPALGLDGVLRWMGLVNVAAGLVFVIAGLVRAPTAPEPSREETPTLEGFGTYALVALLGGFAMMSLQTVVIRIGGLSFGASQFTFAMVVAAFVLCIAIGSFAVSTLARIAPRTIVLVQWTLVALLVALYPVLEAVPYGAHVLRTLFRDRDEAFLAYSLASFAALLAILGLPIVLSGASLPLLFHHLRRQVGDLGSVAGRLYSWNTVGSLLGALLGGYVLFFWLDLHSVYRVAVAALIVAATVLTKRLLGWRSLTAASLGLVSIGALAFLPAWSPQWLSSGLFRSRKGLPATYDGPSALFDGLRPHPEILFYEDDPTTSVAIKEFTAAGRSTRAIITNGKPDGALLFDYTTMALAALVPALLSERAESAFVIGYGTGVTAGELAALDSMKTVVVAEISPAVIEAAPFFDEGNLGASVHPKVKLEIADAYRALLRSPGRFDVIVSEPSNPWVTGVEMLFSREFLAAARARLAPGGVYCQWFHTYETDAATLELVLRTYASVFDRVAVWFTMERDLLLLGFADRDATIDLDRLIERADRSDYRAGLARSGVASVPALLAHELLPLGVVGTTPDAGPIHTLYHPILSQRAARAFFRGETAALPRYASFAAVRTGSRQSLLGRYAERPKGLSAFDRRDALRETCKHRPEECAVLVADWRASGLNPILLKDELARLRRVPRLKEPLDEDRLAELAALYGAQGVTGPLSLEDAEAAAERFASRYHHAAPFDRRALRRLLQSCEETRSQPGRCAANLRLAERTLGPLDGRDGTPIGLAWSGPGGHARLSGRGSPEDRS